MENKNIWIVFSGWWVNGFIYSWIIKYLEEKNIKPVIVWWTSVWSIFSLLIAAWYKYEEILEYINELEKRIHTIKDVDWSSISKSTLRLSLDKTKSLLKWKKIEEELKKILKLKNIKTFNDLNIPYFLHKVDINTWEDICVSSIHDKYKDKNIFDYIRASISIPWIFKPYCIDWSHYIDWGIRSNYPMLSLVDIALNNNIKLDKVISISLIEEKSKDLDYHNKSFFNILLRSIDLSIQDQLDSDAKLFNEKYPDIELVNIKLDKIFKWSMLTAEISKALDYWYEQIKKHLEK